MLVRPLDLFPHTNHFMTVALLVRIPQADLLHPHRSGQVTGQGVTMTSDEPRPPAPPGTDPEPVSGLSAEQQSWLDLNTRTYGASFDREKWIESLLEQNRRAVQGRGLGPPPPAPVPAPRPPSPYIPPMPAFPVAPSTQDPGEYAKYKRDYDAYTDWYNKYSTLYAAKQERLTKSATTSVQGSVMTEEKLPDPNAVPPGVDPVAWRKYCNDTRDYYHKYKSPQAQAVASTSTVSGGPGFDSKKSVAEQMADEILRKRGLMGQFK